MKKFLWTPAFALVVVLGGALPAFASSRTVTATGPGPTPSGLVGAWNMMHDGTMAPSTGGAMDHDNVNGNLGMFRAVCVTAGDFCST